MSTHAGAWSENVIEPMDAVVTLDNRDWGNRKKLDGSRRYSPSVRMKYPPNAHELESIKVFIYPF